MYCIHTPFDTVVMHAVLVLF